MYKVGVFLGWLGVANSNEENPPKIKTEDFSELEEFANSQQGGVIFYSIFSYENGGVEFQHGVNRTHVPGSAAYKDGTEWKLGEIYSHNID